MKNRRFKGWAVKYTSCQYSCEGKVWWLGVKTDAVCRVEKADRGLFSRADAKEWIIAHRPAIGCGNYAPVRIVAKSKSAKMNAEMGNALWALVQLLNLELEKLR